MDTLLDWLGVRERVTLVVHDWGSALGFDWAYRHQDAVRGIAYHLLRARGAEFLTPPFEGREKTQAFFLDPDGHLIEIWQAQGK